MSAQSILLVALAKNCILESYGQAMLKMLYKYSDYITGVALV